MTLLFFIGLAIVIISLVRSERTKDRRADYNRQIGQPDLAAPLPSEAYAAQRKSGRTIVTLLVILVLLIFGWPLLLALLALLASIG
jgi:hypothetical protein